MQPFLIRCVFFFCLAVLHVSFVQMIFSGWAIVPSLLLPAIVAFSMLRGFIKSIWWAFGLGIFVDAILFSHFGFLSLEFSLAAVAFGFAAKRVLVGHSVRRVLLLGVLVWTYQLLFLILRMMVSSTLEYGGSPNMLLVFSGQSLWSICASILFSSIMFTGIFFVTASFERYLEIFDRAFIRR